LLSGAASNVKCEEPTQPFKL